MRLGRSYIAQLKSSRKHVLKVVKGFSANLWGVAEVYLLGRFPY